MTTDPWVVGLEHERSASADERRRRGAWYTPRPVVEALVAEAITADRIPRFVVDPTCGGGAFLLGVLDRMVGLGVAPDDALGRVGGLDLSPGAVNAAKHALELWATQHGLVADAVAVEDLGVGDALGPWPDSWRRAELVIGNPPFATPLKNRAFPASAQEARSERSDLLGPYADLSAVHLAVDIERVTEGGRVCLILPQSLLAGRDTAGLRDQLARTAPPSALWTTEEAVFDAGVRVWAPVLEVGGLAGPVRISSGLPATVTTEDGCGTWAELAAEALGTPTVRFDSERTLGELVTATAGFRDEYYGLAAACREAEPGDVRPRLVTVGSLDPLACSWGIEPMRIAKQTWERPVVEPSALEPRLAAWLDQQLRPKVVLPTQSKVFEPVVDRDGSLAPLTPVLAIHGAPDDLDRVAALLLAPPVVAWARRTWFGSAMSVQAIKLAARDVGALPLPVDEDVWSEAADLIREAERAGAEARATVVAVAELMNGACGGSPEVLSWWLDRFGP